MEFSQLDPGIFHILTAIDKIKGIIMTRYWTELNGLFAQKNSLDA